MDRLILWLTMPRFRAVQGVYLGHVAYRIESRHLWTRWRPLSGMYYTNRGVVSAKVVDLRKGVM